MKRLLPYLCLYFFLVTVTGQGDGSSPEEICPCQTEDSCQGDRHIFGSDPLDIEKFGLISPCRQSNDFPCCPQNPPPPKDVKLTAKDLEGFTPAELAELGINPATGQTIGSSSLPLAQQQDDSMLVQQNQLPIDITQPGAASLAPAGANKLNLVDKNGLPQVAKQQPVYPPQPIPVPPKMPYYRPPTPPVYRPPPPPVYRQPPPPVYQSPAYPVYPAPMYPMARYPQAPMPYPAYRPHHPYKKY